MPVDIYDDGSVTHNGEFVTADEAAFRALADLYPHEAYAEWPERFWQYFQKKHPDTTRDQMERMLEETSE